MNVDIELMIPSMERSQQISEQNLLYKKAKIDEFKELAQYMSGAMEVNGPDTIE